MSERVPPIASTVRRNVDSNTSLRCSSRETASWLMPSSRATLTWVANLHFGPRMTPQLEAKMEFEVENGTDTYRMRLFHAAADSLIFAEEMLFFHQLRRKR